MLGKQGGFLSAGGWGWPRGASQHSAAPGTHAFSPGRLLRGQTSGTGPGQGRPTERDGYLVLNYQKLLRIWPL